MSSKKNINSFANNVNSLVVSTNQALSVLQGLQESLVTDQDTVSVETQTEDGSLTTYKIPAYQSIVRQVDALKKSVDSFINGSGIVNINDGTQRQVTATPIAQVPQKIVGLQDPSVFSINANWFFESLMFPNATVKLDLKGKIEDSADRVKVNRVIIDYTYPNIETFYADNILGKKLTYQQLIYLLENNQIPYSEDLEELSLPLTRSLYVGDFKITYIEIIDGNIWYTLDTIAYSPVNEDGTYGSNMTLSIGDTLSYNNTLFEVIDINTANKKVRLKATLGYSTPGIDITLSFYNTPFQDKIIEIPFGYNEIDIIYIKGVNENFNLLANEWSEPISFISNNLVFSGNDGQNFKNFYLSNISDFGAQWIAQAKEKKIQAYYGYTPNAPVISSNYFSVVQINTQLNAALDSEQVKTLSAQIETTKTNINSLKNTISSLKAELQSTSDSTTYNNIQNKINSNTNELSQLQVSYRTMLKNLQDLVYQNEAVKISPKYRIRGFFPIPESKYSDETNKIGEQKIIGFDIAYRYLKLDNNGTELKTFKYNINGQEYSGIYTDWNMVTSKYLNKVYNDELNVYEWQSENIGDGNEIKINQVDIPINKGEKVEVKIRSISEAGFPDNPLKSEWSESVIMEFPSNLSTSDTLLNLINDANDEQTNIIIDETLNSIGVTAHLDDSVPNPDSVNNQYYKHLAENIAYNLEYVENNNNKVKTTNVEDTLDKILKFFDLTNIVSSDKKLTLREYLAASK